LITCIATAREPLLKNYQVKDGLPSSEVYAVLQDSRGFMWFTTDAGVSRFDGYRFENFTTENGLADNTIFGIYEDRKGRIWFRSFSGRLSYYFQDSIYSIKANTMIDRLHKLSVMTSMYVDKGDTVWCGLSNSSMLFYKIPPGYKTLKVCEDEKAAIHFTRNFYLLEPDQGGFIWGGGHNSNPGPALLSVYDRAGWNTQKAKTTYSVDNIKAIESRGAQGYLLSGMRELVNIRNGVKTFLFPIPEVIAIEEDNKGNLWLGAITRGATFMPSLSTRWEQITTYLTGHSVTGIKEDNEGGIWMTTLENGVFYLPDKDVWCYRQEESNETVKTMAVLAEKGNRVWIGYGNGEINLLTPQHSIPLTGPLKNGRIHTRVNSLVRIDDHKIFVCSGPSYIFNTENRKPVYVQYETIPFLYVRCFAIDHKGNGWVGNHHDLIQMNHSFNIIVRTNIAPGRINTVCIDKNDGIWVGCFNGLWKFENNRFVSWGNRYNVLKSRVEDIKIEPDGSMWVATRGRGVVKIKNNSITHITAKDGLASNITRSLVIDSATGNVWVGTNNGISLLIPQGGDRYRIESFSSKNDLLFKEVNQLVKTEDLIWAATNQGVMAFPADHHFSNTVTPPVYIRSVSIDNETRELAGAYNLKYYEDIVNIRYIGISYKNAGKIRYKYKLDGLDSNWSYTTNTFVQYTTLPPGKYTFKVHAINNDGIESRDAAFIQFAIESPFWEQWWFLALAWLLAGSGIALFFNTRLIILRKREAERTKLNKRVAQMEMKALRAQMNPHFIFNSINSIQHFILKNDSDEAHKYLSKFSRLIRNVLENSKYENISIEQEIQTLLLYIQLEELRFTPKLNYEISIDSRINPILYVIPPMIIQPYVENAIWHGLMHKKEPGKLTIELQLDQERNVIHCIIDDDGIGRAKSAAFKEGNQYHLSVGLSITRERLELINHFSQRNLNVQIIDKYDEHNQPSGTRVEIFLPLVPLTAASAAAYS
jgi:ligand-binding sensor domain-containing protein